MGELSVSAGTVIYIIITIKNSRFYETSIPKIGEGYPFWSYVQVMFRERKNLEQFL